MAAAGLHEVSTAIADLRRLALHMLEAAIFAVSVWIVWLGRALALRVTARV